MNEKQMQEMAVSVLLDEYTQLDVAQLLKEYEEAEEKEELPNVPRTLDKRCSEIIKREFIKKNQKKRFVRISKALSRAAVITLMLIGLGTVSVLSVKAWREPVLRLVLETFDRRSSASIEGNVSHENRTPETIIKVLADSLPKDYKLVQKQMNNGYYQIKFSGDAGAVINLRITECLYNTYFDSEYIEGTAIKVDEIDVIFANKNGYKAIWLDQDSELLIELWATNMREKTFWAIIRKIIQ